jgi:hypothetical protein
MELREVQRDEQLADEELQNRHANSSLSTVTHHYAALEAEVEVGFLAADIISEYEFFVIYEIWVPSRLRRREIGTRILYAAGRLGRDLGYEKALLVPKTLCQEFEQDKLEAWYQRKGYSLLSNGIGQFAKDL